MMMALQPDAVRADAHRARRAEALAPPAPPGFRRHGAFPEMTDTGVIGDPRKASAAKGEKLLEAGSTRLAEELGRGDLWG